MANKKFNPTESTKAYIKKIDDVCEKLRYHTSNSTRFLSDIFDDNFFENTDILRTGCRVWVRYLNDVDLDVESNIKFVECKNDNEHGIRGIKFWDLLGQDNYLPINGNPPSSTDSLKYFSLFGDWGTILGKVLTILDTEGTSKEDYQRGYDQVKSEVQNIVQTFSDFLAEYKTQYNIQFPNTIQNGGLNNGGTGGSGSGSNNGTGGNLPTNSAFLGIDFKNPLTWLVIVVIVFGIKKLFFSQNTNFVQA